MAATKVAYRPDVDGLRAVAVLGVLVYHAFPKALPGGFVGVDIFFVISGYLISGIIWSELECHSFSIAQFYHRRIRRIFPALTLVLATSWILGWKLLFVDEFRLFGDQLAAGSAFIANFILHSQSGYFDPAAHHKPLLHLWSLGIEEQFYIVWPLLLWTVHRQGWRLGSFVIAVIGVSFAVNILRIQSHPNETFYLPYARVWELMAGAWLVHIEKSRPLLKFTDIWAGFGFALLIAALTVIDQRKAFPGFWALIPVIGTVLIVWAGPQSWINRTVLSHPIAVAVGLISYPIYLWHWPLLTYLRIWQQSLEPPPILLHATLILSVLLSILTYWLLEKPVRKHSNRFVVGVLVAAIALLGALGLQTSRSGFYKDRFPAELEFLANYSLSYNKSEAFRYKTCFLTSEQRAKELGSGCVDEGFSESLRSIFIWGDSYVAMLYSGLKQAQRGHNFKLAQFTSCKPYLSGYPEDFCDEKGHAALELIKRLRPKVVLLGASWMGGLSFPLLAETIRQLRATGVNRIVLMGQFPEWVGGLPKALFQNALKNPYYRVPERMSDSLSPLPIALNRSLAAFAHEQNLQFIDPLEILCDQRGCLTRVNPSREAIASFDSGHLTPYGSIYFVEQIVLDLIGRDEVR